MNLSIQTVEFLHKLTNFIFNHLSKSDLTTRLYLLTRCFVKVPFCSKSR